MPTYSWYQQLIKPSWSPPAYLFGPVWTFLFGLKNNLLAAADILLVLITLIWAIVKIYSVVKWVAYLQIPYLLWVSFVTVLQLTVTCLNW
ncbi:hypothetical protein COV89_00670 [Candidatus Shapirobacteria bacterium CG11_big_fil_rev_8_21_14_0_20_40_12]|uniref:Tryptophan-rich sensory protein n=1 Tax=Candidatus Shapirobacteria bacterium CG11_big_fil_rev_8_21_14_0_20_40_12 TaxID=1974889 RepID=A0A2H0KGP4_9BACT|nr:MAG: hypothetical protein COV89_00670 [Candidatus Shapirobacteria bacterium CG11_big_fil_rev_8_21_14_0_20_40_12]